jgi:hypothetical protein
MSYYIKKDSVFRVTSEKALDIYDKLPPGNYILKFSVDSGFYLEQAESFPGIKKLYGNTVSNAARILNTFLDRPAATGVLLSGEKGSGKTLLAKTLSIKGGLMGIPTIIINNDFIGENFFKFLQDIDTPCIVLFDEFEKIYNDKDQEKVLTLFDGTFPSKKLFVITCNDPYRINRHMINRPGRMFYYLAFKGLEVQFIREYCEDNLENKKHIDKIVNFSLMFEHFNFDALNALVEEMNRYREDPAKALEMLNIKPTEESNTSHTIKVILGGKELHRDNCDPTEWKGNPLSGSLYVETYKKDEENNDGLQMDKRFLIHPSDIVKLDMHGGVFEYDVPGGKIILNRKKDSRLNFANFY